MEQTQVLGALLARRLIAIMRDVSPADTPRAAAALAEGGVTALEITFDHARPGGIQQTLDALDAVRTVSAGRVLLGAGTVLTCEEVDLAAEAGAQYIISPDTNPAVIRRTKERGLVSIPGAFTPTEAVTAHAAGADIVKMFPAALLGPAYFKALRGPLAHIRLAAVGGVDSGNAAQFLQAGACCLGVGGSLVSLPAIAVGDFAALTREAAALAHAVRS